MTTLLVSQSYLQAKSIINDNADYETIKPVVEAVQDLYLQKILGTDLYVALQNYVVASQAPTSPIVPIPAQYKVLLDNYVVKYLHWMVVANVGDALKFRYMNKGVMEKSSDNSQPTAIADLKVVTQKWQNFAEQYGENMVKFITAYMSNYPEYSQNSSLEKNKPEGTGFDSPFYFENERRLAPGDIRAYGYRLPNTDKDWWKY